MLVPVVIAVLVAAAQVLPQTSAVQQTPPPAAKTQADAPWPPIGVNRMGRRPAPFPDGRMTCPHTENDIMTDTTKYPESNASSMPFQIAFREDATQADRQNAERSVATLIARSTAAAARTRAAEAELAALTDSLNGPLVRLIEGDPLVGKTLETLRNQPIVQPDVMDALRQDQPRSVMHDPTPLAPQRVQGMRSLGFVPPYDFSWSWHDQNGHPPFGMIVNRPDGNVGLDARSGSLEGGASGFVNAHAGFGVFLGSDTTAQKFPHAVLNPGRFSHAMRAVGIGSNATSEGGFEITVFEDGHFLAGASRQLWRRRISEGESTSGGEPDHVITGPELEFTLHRSRETRTEGAHDLSSRSRTRSTACVDAEAKCSLAGPTSSQAVAETDRELYRAVRLRRDLIEPHVPSESRSRQCRRESRAL